jgi:acetyltransferase
MEKHYLDPLFNPRRVALIAGKNIAQDDAARRALTACAVPVDTVELGNAQLRLQELPHADLAILRVSADEVPAAIDAAALLGARAAVLPLPAATPVQAQAWREAAQRHALRLLGPQTLGLQRPHLHLSAGTLGDPQVPIREGNLALVTQSGALGSAILDWSGDSVVGFSAVVTLGARSDVDLVQVLDFLAHDARTHSILLYIEGVNDARGFMSALRAAAGIKPVIVLKAGRRAAGKRAALTHSGALVGENSVFSAALRRAGAVRVRLVTQLFAAARCLAARYRPVGDRLAVITNGGGPGVLAADWAGESRIRIEPIGASAGAALRHALSPEAVLDNPVDLGEEATPAHYAAAIAALQASPEVDGILVLFSPKAGVDSAAVCAAVIEASRSVTKPLIACWLGEHSARLQRRALEDAGIPTFRTPEPAVDSFANIAQFHRNQQLLQQTPASISGSQVPDVESARLVIESVLAERRQVLTEMESKALLSAFHIPVTRTMVARTPFEAVLVAAQAGYPVAMKVSSPDIAHKSDVGGVVLNVRSANDVRSRWADIMQAVKEAQPEARVEGIAIQKMAVKPTGRELHVGVAHDALFGPVISFGAGGTMIELIHDRAIEFPPLNQFLARSLISRTRVAATLDVFRGMPAVDMAALEDLLIRVSEMVCELPWLKEMDINPVLADAQGVVALDARIVVDHAPPLSAGRHAHMAIRPYPTHLTEEVPLPDGGSYLIRPVRPEDAQALQKLVQELSEESRYFRFISYARELSPRQLARYAQIDYHREMALVAQSDERIVGVSRYMLNPDGRSGEFALVVADDWHGRGLGARLMNALIETAREQGLERLEGFVLGDNQRMLQLMSRLGFAYRRDPEDATLRIVEKQL